MAAKKTKRKYVVVRTYSAGVHVGELVREDGSEVRLAKARRLWSWSGDRLSLHEVAVEGARAGDRVSVEVPEITLKGAIEIITTTDKGEAAFRDAAPYKP